MILLGFYLGTHDSNVAAYIDGRVRYAKSERLTGIKHRRADLQFVRETSRRWGITTPEAVAFSDGNRNGLGTCAPEDLFVEAKPIFRDERTFCLDHHYAHVLSAWPVIDTDLIDVGIAIDGNGDNGYRTRVFRDPGKAAANIVYSAREASFGGLFYLLGDRLGLSGRPEDFAGKLMGLQAYGTPDRDYPGLRNEDSLTPDFIRLLKEVRFRGDIPDQAGTRFYDLSNTDFRDWLASVHLEIERCTTNLFRAFCAPEDRIVYSGGCAQNVVANDALMRKFPRLSIPPHCYDGGLSLGCVEFLRIYYNLPRYSSDEFPFWQDDAQRSSTPVRRAETPSAQTIRTAAEYIARGKIVGWFQGLGEVGPRALGHRSILMDPRNAAAIDVLNARVKHREYWRPFGASVLLEDVSGMFDLESESPYMLRAVPVHASKAARIPAIVHNDGTCRVQTVGKVAALQSFATLLEDVRNLTGLSAVLNTSLNSRGRPICNAMQDAIALFGEGGLDVLCVGDRVHVK